MNLFRTERCIVRRMKPEDWHDLFAILSDEKVMRYIEQPFSEKQTKQFIEEAGMNDPPLVYAIVYEENQRLIGHLIFHPYEEDAYEIGWILHRNYWGRRIATELTQAAVEYAKEKGIPKLLIQCSPEQKSTIAIAQKFGFERIGVEGIWCFEKTLDYDDEVKPNFVKRSLEK